ncbi:hypothetical protein D3C75_795270 [compost metagenome]
MRERGHFGRQCQCLITKFRERYHTADQTAALGFFCQHRTATEDHFHGLVLANGACKTLCTSGARNGRQSDFGQGEACVIGSDDDVAHHRQLTAATQCQTTHRRDHRFTTARGALPVGGDELPLEDVHHAPLAHHLDVCAGGEGLVAADQHDGADHVIRLELIEHGRQLVHQLIVQCVVGFWSVQAYHADIFLFFQDEGFKRHISAPVEAGAEAPGLLTCWGSWGRQRLQGPPT